MTAVWKTNLSLGYYKASQFHPPPNRCRLLVVKASLPPPRTPHLVLSHINPHPIPFCWLFFFLYLVDPRLTLITFISMKILSYFYSLHPLFHSVDIRQKLSLYKDEHVKMTKV